MKKVIYKQLFRINRGFHAALHGLTRLRKYDVFDRSELRRMHARVRELRASTNSYLAAALESAETEEADRLFRHRIDQEKAEE